MFPLDIEIGGSVELDTRDGIDLTLNAMMTGNESDQAKLAQQQAVIERYMPRLVKYPLGMTVPGAGSGVQQITDAPNLGRRLEVRRLHLDTALPLSTTGAVQNEPIIVVPNSVFGTATTPAANGVIANAGQNGSGANFPPGLYQITVSAWYGSTADVANNMKLVAAGVATITQLDVSPTVNGPPNTRTLTYYLPSPAVFQVQAIAGGAAGAVYNATIDVTPLSGANSGQSISNIGIYLVGDTGGAAAVNINPQNLSSASVLRFWNTLPVDTTFGRQEIIIQHPENLYLVISSFMASPIVVAGNIQTVDMPGDEGVPAILKLHDLSS